VNVTDDGYTPHADNTYTRLVAKAP
jgi:hypothetical protein